MRTFSLWTPEESDKILIRAQSYFSVFQNLFGFDKLDL